MSISTESVQALAESIDNLADALMRPRERTSTVTTDDGSVRHLKYVERRA